MILFCVISLLSFLLTTPFHALLLLMPNFILGFLDGVFAIQFKKPLWRAIIVFMLAIITNFLSLLALQMIMGVNYHQFVMQESEFMVKIFPEWNLENTKRAIFLILPTVYVLDALCKTCLLIVLFQRFAKLFSLEISTQILPKRFIFHPLIGVSAIMVYAFGILCLVRYVNTEALVWQIFGMMFLLFMAIFGIYLLFQVNLFLAIVWMNKSFWLRLLVMILSVLLFGLTILFGIMLNFILYCRTPKKENA